MTSDVLEALLRANIAGSIGILLVLVLRKPLRRLAGARIAYGLWIIVPLMAAGVFLPAWAPVAASAIGLGASQVATPDFLASLLASQATLTTLFVVWSLGVAASLALTAWRHGLFVGALGPVKQRDPGVVQAETSRLGPAVIGFLRPTIILPSDFDQRFSAAEQALIIAHEARHVKEGHIHLNAAMVLAQAVNWFNPLVHLAAYVMRIDQELACDAGVVRSHPAGRRAYAEAMVKTQLVQERLALGCYWPSRSEHPLNERIAMLTHEQPGRARRWTGAIALAAFAIAGGCASWSTAPAKDRLVPINGKPVFVVRPRDESKPFFVPVPPGGVVEEKLIEIPQQDRTEPVPAPQAAPVDEDRTEKIDIELPARAEPVRTVRIDPNRAGANGKTDEKIDIELQVDAPRAVPAPGRVVRIDPNRLGPNGLPIEDIELPAP